MLFDSIEPTEILHYANSIIKIFLLSFCRLKSQCYVTTETESCAIPWIFSSIRMLFCISEIKAFCIDNVVVLLLFGFSITSNKLHQKLCTAGLVIRWSSLAGFICSIYLTTSRRWVDVPKHFDLLIVIVSITNSLMWIVIIWMS